MKQLQARLRALQTAVYNHDTLRQEMHDTLVNHKREVLVEAMCDTASYYTRYTPLYTPPLPYMHLYAPVIHVKIHHIHLTRL